MKTAGLIFGNVFVWSAFALFVSICYEANRGLPDTQKIRYFGPSFFHFRILRMHKQRFPKSLKRIGLLVSVAGMLLTALIFKL
jgi:hypothetical protein